MFVEKEGRKNKREIVCTMKDEKRNDRNQREEKKEEKEIRVDDEEQKENMMEVEGEQETRHCEVQELGGEVERVEGSLKGAEQVITQQNGSIVKMSGEAVVLRDKCLEVEKNNLHNKKQEGMWREL